MRIGIIGGGIAGMTAAYKLADSHTVTLFEAASALGGHTATKDVISGERHLAIDTGFIVYNDRTYPEFIRLLDELGVENQTTRMSFSVSDRNGGIEYAGSSLNSLFAQRRNLLSPRFLGMLRDILRFNRTAPQHIRQRPEMADLGLGDYLQRFSYSAAFRDLYLIPMGAAIWSSSRRDMLDFPLGFFVRFFHNHGLLSIKNRPQWRVIKGGSRNYIGPLTEKFRNDVRLNCRVSSVVRRTDEWGNQTVEVSSNQGTESFDQVVFACHSDQALAILGDASPAEKSVLEAIPYVNNEVVLHYDDSLLPRNRRCWSSWNVCLNDGNNDIPKLTYNMNILQGLDCDRTYCVTLNQTSRIREECVVGVYQYQHPVFTREGVSAQQRWAEINGKQATWYCGAYWRNGFHEDGVWSALRVAESLGALHEKRRVA